MSEKIVKKYQVRKGCNNCGEEAIKRHTFLLSGARGNPASNAYRKDDCSWSSDFEQFSCGHADCIGQINNDAEGYEKNATFDYVPQFAHMFNEWREEDITAKFKELEHEFVSSQGLWCIDRNPADVDYDWIKRNSFQLGAKP